MNERPSQISMPVPMMNIGVVFMRMFGGFVYVGVGMRLLPVPAWVVLMLVVDVVNMGVFVHQRFVAMPVHMNLGEMQPYTSPHE